MYEVVLLVMSLSQPSGAGGEGRDQQAVRTTNYIKYNATTSRMRIPRRVEKENMCTGED